MKNLIHISKIRHKNDKYLEVYYSTDDDCFEYYHFEDGVFELVDPYEMDYTPENYELDFDDDINKYKLNPKKKKYKKLLTSLKAATATILAGITITSAYPKILEVLDYTVMKSTTIFTTGDLVDKNTSNEEFKSLFNESIQKNLHYTQEEKDLISTGYQKFLDDWGYLLDETQKEYILYKAQSVKVQTGELEGNIDGLYDGNITLQNRDDVSTTSHEAAHSFSDHGVTLGTRSAFLGKAINEALNTTITNKYIYPNTTYDWERLMTFLIEQLVGTETLVKLYATRDAKIDYLINEIKENCPGSSYLDIIKFIATIDLQCKLSLKKETDEETLERLQESALEQYKYLFKLKNGIDLENSWLYELSSFNIMDKEVTIEIIDNLKSTVYVVPRELLNKPKTFDISHYYKEIKYTIGTAGIVLNFLALDQEKLEAKSRKELIELVENRYSANPDLNAKFQSLKDYTKKYDAPKNLDEIKTFIELTLNTLLSQETDPKKIACLMKDLLFSITEDKVALYHSTIIYELKKLNLTEILYYYAYTTVYWDTNDSVKVSEEYEELSDCYDCMFFQKDNLVYLLMRVPENKIPYSINGVEFNATKIPKDSEDYKQYETILGKDEGDIYIYTGLFEPRINDPIKLIDINAQVLEKNVNVKM